jgi:ligand-binding sensor domain-containing protein/signal transduction histidine kinase
MLSTLPGHGQSTEPGGVLRDLAVRTWTKADGLPDDSVTTLLQTSDGYLWVGTGSGLVRFDGVKFAGVQLGGSGTNASASITALCEDSGGRLWIGTQQGLFCRPLTGALSEPATLYDKGTGLVDENVTSLTTDAEGRVWVGTPEGVSRWDGGKFTAFTTSDGLPDKMVSSVHAAKSGAVWITTRGGMCRFVQGKLVPFQFPSEKPERAYEDVRGNLWAFCATYVVNLAEGRHEGKRRNYFPGEKSASMRIWSLCEGRGGRLWIGASGRGVFCFDGTDFEPVMLNEGRWPNDVRAICEDHEGNLWLGISGGGLTQLRPQSFVMLKGSQGLPPGAATCVALDGSGRLCVGMDCGGVYAAIGEHFERVADQTGALGQDVASSLCAGPDGSLWAGTLGTGLYRIKGNQTAVWTTVDGLSDDCILAVCAGAEGNVWAGTKSGALHRFANNAVTSFGKVDGLPGTPVTALLVAHGGGLWVGTGNGILLRCNPARPEIASVRLAPRLRGKQILGLYESADGKLWVGTAGGGLGCLTVNGCSAWDTQGGLPDDMISGVVGDTEGGLWLVTGQGLCRVARDSVADALTHGAPLKARLLFETGASANRVATVGWPRAIRSAEGRLWFATTSGLVGIDPHGWAGDKPPPQVHLEALLVDNRAFHEPLPERTRSAQPTRLLKLPASPSALEFQFTALSFEAPEKIRFRHKLDRYDADWIDTGPERSVKYGRLPSGDYEFHVTACNAEGIWNPTGTSLSFVIPTPLWRTPWALALYGLSAAGGVAGAVRLVSHRRLRRHLALLQQQQATERERVRIAQDMHDEIGSKLTKISFLSERAKVELKEPERLAGKIDSIAITSRELLQALDEIVWAVNPRNDTLEQLGSYLSQYAREYLHETPAECEVNLQGELPNLAMSAEVRHNLFLAFEESLNNVLKHSGASKVRIEFRVGKGRLQISVRDNGRGFKVHDPSTDGATSAVEGNGVVNMHQRLQDIGGQCTIESTIGKGTTVELSLPLDSSKVPIR